MALHLRVAFVDNHGDDALASLFLQLNVGVRCLTSTITTTEAAMEAMENTTFAQIGSLSRKYSHQLLQENPVECFGGRWLLRH